VPVTKAQLIDAANEAARALGLPPVSESVVESWIRKRLLKGARPRGRKRGVPPDWCFPDSVIDIVKNILVLKSLGAARTTQLVIGLVLLGFEMDHQRIRTALKSEFRRIAKRQERGPNWWKDHHKDLSPEQRPFRISQLPSQDSVLIEAGFALPPDLSLDIGLRAFWGLDDGDTSIRSLLFGDTNLTTPDANQLTKMFAIDGALGLPSESAVDGYEVLEQITPEDMKEARTQFCICAVILILMATLMEVFPTVVDQKTREAFAAAAASIWRAEWFTSSAALLAISAFSVRHEIRASAVDR
jgi:hypothetical protein